MGKQAQVLEFALGRYRQDTGKASEENFLPNISREHLYEICSVMLERCYTALVPEGGLAILEFLAAKDLQVLFREEFRKQEKVLLPDLTVEQQREYYYSIVVLIGRLDSRLIEEDLLEQCRESYLSLSKNKRQATLLMDLVMAPIQLKLAENKSSPGKSSAEKLDEKLVKFDAAIDRDGDDLCRFHLALAHAAYELEKGTDPSVVEGWYRKANEVVAGLTQAVHRDEAVAMQLRSADLFATRGEYGRAYERFVMLFEKLPADSPLWRDSALNLRLAEFAITIGEFEHAQKIIDERLQHLFYIFPTHRAVRAAILLALLAIFKDDPDAGLRYVELAQRFNSRRNYTFALDLQCRYLECACYVLRGEHDLVKAVISRGIQLLRTRKMSLKKDVEGHYFLILESFMKYVALGKRVKDKRIKYYSLFTSAQYGAFGKLLQFARKKLNVPLEDVL
ncbi:MAG: hypothetical protein JSS75_08515 [Bacteroidetes bacterium]|nr:hypothetical protein [Bacteroidota bacterium]